MKAVYSFDRSLLRFIFAESAAQFSLPLPLPALPSVFKSVPLGAPTTSKNTKTKNFLVDPSIFPVGSSQALPHFL